MYATVPLYTGAGLRPLRPGPAPADTSGATEQPSTNRQLRAARVVGLQWVLCTSGGLVIAIFPMLLGFIIAPRAFVRAHSAPA